MKNLIYLLLLSVTLISCSEEKVAKRINWTSESQQAIQLFEEFLKINEYEKDMPEYQEKLMDSIMSLDSNFVMAKTYDSFGTDEENREIFMSAYENRGSVSDIEKRLIEANYQRFFNGNRIVQDSLIDELINDYPDYYQLRLISGNVKNNIDVKGCQKRWQEALEINPKSFSAHLNLAKLHFPVIASFQMLAIDERDLGVATKYLTDGEKSYPQSSRWSRYLGNVYRSQGKLNESREAYRKAGKVIEEFEGGKETPAYAEIIYLIGHVNTALEEYSEAREAYFQTAELRSKISDENTTLFSNVSMRTFIADSYLYQKDFANAVYVVSEAQSIIQNTNDVDELTKINISQYAEFYKFLIFGHSQKQEEALSSINNMYSIIDSRLEYFLNIGLSQEEMKRRKTGSSAAKLGMKIWYNILFGEYEEARNMLTEFKEITDLQLTYNPRAQTDYYKYLGYLNLMEGNPQESINAYNQIPKEVLNDDNYHMYFFALSKRAIGQNEESKSMMISLANDNFATWQNAIVKNLAKAQIKTNI